MKQLLVAAGEASGDLHAARAITALRARGGKLEVFGLGGDELAGAGTELLAHSSEIAVVGIVEVLKVLKQARRIFAQLVDAARERRPDVALLVDSPEFNLRLAKELKALGIPVVYYISPQLWAWRKGRVEQVRRRVDRMLVLFPFEVDFYREHGIEAQHVGHPLVDEVPVLPQAWDRPLEGPLRLALLPGSRRSELAALLAPMLEAAALIGANRPVRVRVIRAPTISRAELEAAMVALGHEVEIVDQDRFAVIADSHLALCASGTATLEVGLLGTPMIVAYRLKRWSYLLGKAMVRLPHYTLVNLVLEERVVPELIQDQATGPVIARQAEALLDDPSRLAAMRERLGELRLRLGPPGASTQVAAVLDEMLVRGRA